MICFFFVCEEGLFSNDTKVMSGNKFGVGLAVAVGVGAGFGPVLAFKRHARNYDAAFNQIMWELWENPDRDRSVRVERNPRIQELQRYLDSGFWNQVWNEPPLGAMERFKGVSVQEYDKHCLEVATKRFEDLKSEMKQNEKN